jgi:transposase
MGLGLKKKRSASDWKIARWMEHQNSSGCRECDPKRPLGYDRALYKKRNEVERLFRRLKGFRRILSRFEKLDIVFLAFIYFAFIVEALREC